MTDIHVNLGPDPEIDRANRAAWDQRAASRRKHDTSGKWASLRVELAPALGFFAIVNKISERAKARGEVGEGGGSVWDLAEWKRFCKAARDEGHLQVAGTAVFRTVRNVELMIAEGKTAREIHQALFWKAREDDKAAALEAETARKLAEQTARASFETAVKAKMLEERVKIEARQRTQAERDESYAPRSQGRVAV